MAKINPFYQLFCFKLPLCLILGILSIGLAQSTDRRASPKTPTEVSTQHFEISVKVDDFSSQLEYLEQHADTAFESVSRRLGVTIDEPIEVIFEQPSKEPCPIRALARPMDNSITFYLGSKTSPKTLMGFLAHEIGHVLHIRGLEVFTGDRGLFEGLATWAGGNYWATMQGSTSLDASVRRYQSKGSFLNLYEYPDLEGAYEAGPACIERRDILYTEWGSFVGYLIDNYGMEKFLALMATSPPVAPDRKPKLPDYVGIYEQSLRDLHSAWANHVLANGSTL